MVATFAVLLIGVTLFILALASRAQDRSWISPVAMFALVWAAYLPTLLFFVDDAAPFVAGMLWILLSVAAVSAGSVTAGMLCPPVAPRLVQPSQQAIRLLRKCLLAPLVIGTLDVSWLFAQRGYSLRNVFSITALMFVTASNRAEAYAGEADTPVLQRIAFMLLYLGTFYGGSLFRLSPRRADRLLAFGALLMTIVVNSLHGSRFGSIYGGSCWLAAFLATHVMLRNPERGAETGFLVRFATAGAVIVFVFSVATMTVRYSVFGGSGIDWKYMLSDPFGYVAAFGVWFNERGLHPDGPFWGARVFRRVLASTGPQSELYAAVDVGFNTSNVFTIFRQLMEDFTPVGSLQLLVLYGFLARVAFWKASNGRTEGATWLAIAYVVAFTSVASSPFQYTTLLLAMVLYVVTFRLLPRMTESAVEA